MRSSIIALNSYFANHLPKLKEIYQWKIPEIKGFDSCGEQGYFANVKLKKFLSERWTSASRDEKTQLARVITSDWGGVRGNLQSTLEGYVDQTLAERPYFPLKGIASYSKILSISDLSKYAIYDARVAASLNAIQWNTGIKNGLAFHYIPGRNNITGNIGKKSGFAYHPKFNTASLAKNNWELIKADDTYRRYLELLHACRENFPHYMLYDLEMVLFANAEAECQKAMQS